MGFSEPRWTKMTRLPSGSRTSELAVFEGDIGLDVVGFEIALELGSVGGGEGYGREADIRFGRWRGEDLDPLRVVDGIEPHAVGFFALEAQRGAVELLRGGGIGSVETGEGDSCDGRASGLLGDCGEG